MSSGFTLLSQFPLTPFTKEIIPAPINEITSAKKLISLDLPIKLDAFVKTVEEIDLAKNIGLWGVEILVGVNDQLLTSGDSRHKVLERCRLLTEHAKELGLHTCLFGGDATRTSEEFLEEMIDAFNYIRLFLPFVFYIINMSDPLLH